MDSLYASIIWLWLTPYFDSTGLPIMLLPFRRGPGLYLKQIRSGIFFNFEIKIIVNFFLTVIMCQIIYFNNIFHKNFYLFYFKEKVLIKYSVLLGSRSNLTEASSINLYVVLNLIFSSLSTYIILQFLFIHYYNVDEHHLLKFGEEIFKNFGVITVFSRQIWR